MAHYLHENQVLLYF